MTAVLSQRSTAVIKATKQKFLASHFLDPEKKIKLGFFFWMLEHKGQGLSFEMESE